MSKIKTSISLDEKLVAALDKQAKADGISRSELIERMCRRSLDDEPKVEFFRMHGMPTQLVPALSAMSWHDEDGPVELVIRVSNSDWDAWRRNRTSQGRSKRARGG
jgi:hypothetical protein